jgi:hypothetical protein
MSLLEGNVHLIENGCQQTLDVLCLGSIDREFLGKVSTEGLSVAGLIGLVEQQDLDPSAKEVIELNYLSLASRLVLCFLRTARKASRATPRSYLWQFTKIYLIHFEKKFSLPCLCRE